MSISKVIEKYKFNEQPNDFVFWQSRSYEERLVALERFEKHIIHGDRMLTRDFKAFIGLLNAQSVRYLVAGGYAVAS